MLETRTSWGYMPLYIADYDADTSHLSTLEHGAYFLLIKAYWRSGGPLPDSDFRLANIAHLSLDAWQAIKPIILEFFRVEEGKWIHKRIDFELAHFRDKSEKARASRKAGIEKRRREKEDRERGLFDAQNGNGRSTDVQRSPMSNGRSTSVTEKNLPNGPNSFVSGENGNGRSTDVQRTFNGRSTTQTKTHKLQETTTTEHSGSSEVLPKTETVQHQSIAVAFRAAVGRPMKKIDVECLAQIRKNHTDQQIETGIYIAGIRAKGLGKKPGSLSYFEAEIDKAAEAEIANPADYIRYLKNKLEKTKPNGVHA